MRQFMLALLAIPLLAAVRADDKDAKAKAEGEKKLAESDREMMDRPLSVENRKVIADLVKHLQAADQMDVYRLEPVPAAIRGEKEKAGFHKYEIIAEVAVETAEQRVKLGSFVGGVLHWNKERMALCFNPRHGARVTSGKRTLDFLICFECHVVAVYEGEKFVAELPLVEAKDNPLEEFLKGVEKKDK